MRVPLVLEKRAYFPPERCRLTGGAAPLPCPYVTSTYVSFVREGEEAAALEDFLRAGSLAGDLTR